MNTLFSLLMALTLSCSVMAQSPRPKRTAKHHRTAQTTSVNQPGALTAPGSGTPGHLGKWITSSFLGDSSITEDKSGNVGIGTPAASSTLTVGGLIETITGGIKFPDGSIQTSAATALNHDLTLKGDGTGNPLGVAVPLILSGAVNSVITATNSAVNGSGIVTNGGPGDNRNGGGLGLVSHGGMGRFGGEGLQASGGDSSSGFGGLGGALLGGSSANGIGGDGLFAMGGTGAGAAVDGLAGEFQGDVHVSGNLSKGGGSFKIDHPVDPANKYLYHSFVESPDMMNIYNGVITLDSTGEAIVELPEWFTALNRDFRYLLTPIGAPGPTLYIAEEVNGNHFKIAGGSPRMKVSWLVTGIRQDAWANAHRIPVEEEKPASERGYYLHPELFGQPEHKGVQWARNPELMQRVKESRDRNKPAQDVVSQ